jgi:hypothetical protein
MPAVPAFAAEQAATSDIGTLVAVDMRLPPPAVTALGVGLALAHGVLNGVAMQQAGAGVLELLGPLAALFVLVSLVAVCMVLLHSNGRGVPCAGLQLDCRHEPVNTWMVPARRELRGDTSLLLDVFGVTHGQDLLAHRRF